MVYVVHPANHALWYVAQLCLGSSFIAPSLFALRFMLGTGFFFLMLWSIIILKISVDSTVFGAVYMVINFVQFGRLVWARRHVSFDADRERVYENYFGEKRAVDSRKWQCSRVTWKDLCVGSRVATLRRGEAIARAGDRCTSFTFLLEGELSFQRSGGIKDSPAEIVPMHAAAGLSVVDAVEYIHRGTARGAVWGIDVVASTDSVRVLILTYEQLDRVSKEDMMIEATINGICGVQLTHMLFSAESVRLHDCMKPAPGTAVANSAATNSQQPPSSAKFDKSPPTSPDTNEETEMATIFHLA